jgi:hypothetical protein
MLFEIIYIIMALQILYKTDVYDVKERKKEARAEVMMT